MGGCIIGLFDGENSFLLTAIMVQLDRAGKFLSRYEGVLEDAGKMDELRDAVKDKYGVDI